MLLPFLKTKPYYVRVNGKLSQEALLKSITAGLCPELVYAKLSSQESLTAFEAFVESSKGLLITTQDIKAISQIKKVSPNDQM